jgi:hypothetical protein
MTLVIPRRTEITISETPVNSLKQFLEPFSPVFLVEESKQEA